MSQEYSFSLPYDAFDRDLIGLPRDSVDSAVFVQQVSEFFARQYRSLGGRAQVICNDQDRVITVRWTKDRDFQDPRDRAQTLLRAGKLAEALPLLWTLHHAAPDDIQCAYNLGLAHSELGHLDKALEILAAVVQMDPTHVDGWIALAVAQIRSQQLKAGEDSLRQALEREPTNLYALRNLGACLLKLGRATEAVRALQAAVAVAPNDLPALIGLGQAWEEVGQATEADACYVKALQLGGPQPLMELAQERRTALASQTMRSRGAFRPDVMMYIAEALKRFATMSPAEIQAVGFEVARLGQSGLDINDPTPQYSLRSWPGQYSGLHLCSIMYAAFQEFAPGTDVGIDFAQEYAAAKGGVADGD
jgi:tetratricopeptide (TPR) repeat protein